MNKKSPVSFVQFRRAEVEKIGLTSTSFGINFSPEQYKKRQLKKAVLKEWAILGSNQ
jgi:hypothetical protein